VEKKTFRLAVGDAGSPPFSAGSFSGDSRFVASGTPYGAGLFDLQAGTNARVCINCDSLSVSGDGRYVAFRWRIPGRPDEIYVRDMQSGAMERISISTGGTNVNRWPSKNPVISYDGRYVVFASTASDLVPNDLNQTSDIFVRDRLRGLTFLASPNLAGTQSANGTSVSPVLAADGRTILFYSDANDLVEGDYNVSGDIFALRLGGPDTDGDGLDDDWELAYFNTLDRDGSGDFDADGHSDKAEFTAGTNPSNSDSVLRVRTITTLGGASTKVQWDSAPGRAYRVQWKDSVNALAWESGETVIAPGTTASWTDSNPNAAQRFYRVVLVP
jgi:hypothetical protein